nr:kinetochore scaffold 1 [Pogona vitticeps]XP_020651428.1 kinetochore scaffold 1 [Pogona vitticeps]
MDRTHSETNEEKDFTDRTNKRYSSILKAPRTPLRDLGSGNELIQECIVEKHQKNSRRVSFADTIRIFPPDPQATVELNHAGTTEEPRHQNVITKNEELEVVPCEITGMNTLLHAPIQTPLQQMEVFYANSGLEWNKIDKTLIFSEENEMDMTSGHTILITHDIKNCQENDNSGKIDFKSFSDDLKSKKEASQVNKFNFFSGPTFMNNTCSSQHKRKSENTQKVNFGDFLKSLKSTKQLPTLTADIVASEDNVLREENNTITTSKGLNDLKRNYLNPVLSNKGISFASKQLRFQEMSPPAQEESVEMFTANGERSLPLGTSVCNIVSEQENCRRDVSNYQIGVQLDPSMCINEKTKNTTETNTNLKNSIMATKNDNSLPCYRTSTMAVATGSVTSMPVHSKDATTTFSRISTTMELTRNDTRLIWEDSSKKIYPIHGDPEKGKTDVSKLERTTCREDCMDISTNYFLKNTQYSIFSNEKAVPNEEVTCNNMGQLNQRIKPVPQVSCLPEKKENDCFHCDEPQRSSVVFSKNGILNSSFVSKSSRKQRESQILSPADDDRAQTSEIHSKINSTSGLSNNSISLIPEDKTATPIFSQNMEITKCTTNSTNNNPDVAEFQRMPQEEWETNTRSMTRSDSNKTVVFSLTGYNEMEITKSHTVPVNFDMQQCGRTAQPLSLQHIDRTVYHTDMDETKAITGIIDQPMENARSPEMHKEINESVRRTLTGSTKDRTTVFSLSDENEMEISRSHTLALDHNAVTQGEHMDITNPVVSLTDKSLRNATDSIAVVEQKVNPGKRINGLSSGKIMHSQNEDNEMKLTESLLVTVEGAPQTLSSLLPEKTMSVHSSMAKSKTIPFVVADKTVLFMHNNDMEITKPLTCISMQDNGSKNMECSIQETSKRILSRKSKEEKPIQLQAINDMEITRSHTVAVNHDILQQAQLNTQGLISALVDKTNMPVLSSGTTITQSTVPVPVDKTVLFMHNDDMEITKSVSDAFLKNSFSSYLPQKGKEAKEITLSGSVKDNSSVLSLCYDEMEITKCHTVAVNYDSFPKCEKLPQDLFCQDNIDITESHTVSENTRENLHKNATELGKNAEWDLSSKSMVALAVVDMNVSEKHIISLDCKRSIHNLPDSYDKPLFSVTSYQDGTKVTNLPTNTVDSGDLEESERNKMPNKSIQQNLIKVLPLVYGGKTKDTESAENHTVSIYGSNNNVPDVENQVQNSFTNSRGGENMDVTRNYTTEIECMHINNNECYLHSQAKSNSEFSASAITCEKKLNISQTVKDKYSTCSETEMLLIPQEQHNFLKIKDNQLKSSISEINDFGKDATLKAVSNKENDFMFPVNMQNLDPKLSEEAFHDLNTNRMYIPLSENKNSKGDPKKLSWQRHEYPGETSDLSDDGKITNSYEAMSGELNNYSKDWQNLESLPVNTFPSEEKPVLLPKISGAANICSKRKDRRKKSEPDLICQDVESCLGDALPELTVKSDSPSVLKEDAKESNISSKKLTNTGFTENAPFKVPINAVCTNSCEIKKVPLGIFPPKLPNKRKSSLSNAEAIDAKSEKRTEIDDSQNGLIVKSPSDKIANLSPSNYINEELLPAYVEEMDSDESLNCNASEKVCEVIKEKEIAEKEGYLSEMYETNKRQRVLNEEEELQKEKKFKGNQDLNDAADLPQSHVSAMVTHKQAKTFKGKNVPEMSLEKTESSNSSSLGSVKADADFSIQRNTEMETQLLLDSICEQNLREKLQEGTITVREFFTLLEVHVLIQKPRQSQLPFKYEVNTLPTLEDEILSQYIYHPKLQAYEEDCQGLYKTIEELKSHAVDQDKLLVNVHKSLWEVMRTCSDEELKGFGAELNKMKSCFTKKSKVLAHRRKAKLYAKLVQNAQFQWEKLQSRLGKIDELLKETDSCLVALETEIALIEDCDLNAYNAMSEYESKLRNAERELENLRAQDETFQRTQSNLKDKKKQIASEICHIQKDIKNSQELVEKYNFSEWVIKEWNDNQAVFTFLYDSVELTVGLACPLGDAIFSSKIVSVNFESLLDEAKALPSAKLVHRLIFQFINSQGSWQEKCLTVPHLSQMLHDVSLVVSRCQFLEDEIEFLKRWGGKYYLLKTELNDTKLKLLFSSCHAKFEIEFSLSADYPVTPVAFAIQKCTGNLTQEEISVVLSSIPVGANYLRRTVKQISESLLHCPSSTVCKKQRAALR